MKLFYQYMTYMAIFLNVPHISTHLLPIQVENCDSNSRLVVGEGDNGKFRLERVNALQNSLRSVIAIMSLPYKTSCV